MITMKQWMDLVGYKITEGGDYGWQCYGNNSYALSSWNGVQGHGGHNADIVFSTKTQRVYEVTVCDYANNRAYRLINPSHVKRHNKEAATRGVLANCAWDDVNYVDLEVVEDFVQKARAILAGQDYSTDISVPLDMPDDEMLAAMKAAHEAGMSFNDYVVNALKRLVDEFDSDPERTKTKFAAWKKS